MALVGFTQMIDGTPEDFELLHREGQPYIQRLPDRLLGVLNSMRDAFEGYQITSLYHLLQTATRAERDGAGEEMIVAALLHDIGDVLAPHNQAEYAASVIRPYVSEETHWIIQHHGIFQLYHYGHHTGADRNARDRYRGSPYFESCARFCERWDQSSFDPNYNSRPLEYFEPMLRRILSRKPFDPAVIRK